MTMDDGLQCQVPPFRVRPDIPVIAVQPDHRQITQQVARGVLPRLADKLQSGIFAHVTCAAIATNQISCRDYLVSSGADHTRCNSPVVLRDARKRAVHFYCPTELRQSPAKHCLGILLAHHQSVGIWDLRRWRDWFNRSRFAYEVTVAIVEARRQVGLGQLTYCGEYAQRFKNFLRSGADASRPRPNGECR